MKELFTKKHAHNIKKCGGEVANTLLALKSSLSTQGDDEGIDSYYFRCTPKHFERFLKAYKPTPYTSSHRGGFFTPKDRIKAQDRGLEFQGYKIGGIRIQASSNSTLFDKNRHQHKKLGSLLLVELHGFFQYTKHGERKPLSPQAQKVGEYFLKTPRFSKLQGFDYAIDFKEKMQISYQEAIQKIPSLKKLKIPSTQKYASTLYFQKHAPQFGHQAPLYELSSGILQRLCIYDKQKKNSLDRELTRFEFRILIDKVE